MRVTGLSRGLSEGLARPRAPRAVHDPRKIIADLAAVALGGDCLADIAVLANSPPGRPGCVRPSRIRLIKALAADGPRALKTIRAARVLAQARAWALAGEDARGADGTHGDHGPGRDDRDRALAQGSGLPDPVRRLATTR
jgi:hypothetical protein